MVQETRGGTLDTRPVDLRQVHSLAPKSRGMYEYDIQVRVAFTTKAMGAVSS